MADRWSYTVCLSQCCTIPVTSRDVQSVGTKRRNRLGSEIADFIFSYNVSNIVARVLSDRQSWRHFWVRDHSCAGLEDATGDVASRCRQFSCDLDYNTAINIWLINLIWIEGTWFKPALFGSKVNTVLRAEALLPKGYHIPQGAIVCYIVNLILYPRVLHVIVCYLVPLILYPSYLVPPLSCIPYQILVPLQFWYPVLTFPPSNSVSVVPIRACQV